jgi:predicted O-methyltransferase YrrM
MAWIDEAVHDQDLRSFVIDHVKNSSQRLVTDARAEYGRRLGWYAIVRATKPTLVVETGVDKGLGSVVLCAALMRNAMEGFKGRYVGTDINPSAGEMLSGKYAQFGRIEYGDSIETLSKMNDTIDVFINDSDHSADYERREYKVVANKLSANSVIIGDNAHVSDELASFASRTSRGFIAVHELPEDHWYLGATMGLAFVAR